MTHGSAPKGRKIGRNQPCPCGNGRKYKHCHGSPLLQQAGQVHPPYDIAQIRAEWEARERVRQTQQGLGRPIISAKVGDQQVVAVGNKIHSSSTWKTFPDFLSDYLKQKLDPAWGNAEIAKPLGQRHPVMQWYDHVCRLQRQSIKTAGVPASMPVTGVLACYYGLAYGLYLLDHNVELQDRLVARLKNPGNFQGAYYEVVVARALISAGFELTLEDETDPGSKHCEFAAVSKKSGEKFWVEAKMRGVSGLLGRTEADGATSSNPISRLVPQLNAAFQKPAAGRRMIFIDLNAEMSVDASDERRPTFVSKVNARLQRYEKTELPKGESAYLFVTNMTFHRELDALAQMVAIPVGVGIPDFNRSGHFRLYDVYLSDQKHADAHRVAKGLSNLLSLPMTFDGSMPATTLHGDIPPVTIGQTYCFEAANDDGSDIVGTVADVTVMEEDKCAMIAVNCDDGSAVILRDDLSDTQLADYKAHPDAYFGKIKPVSREAKTPYELFQFFMEAYIELPRAKAVKQLKLSDRDAAELSNEQMRALFCERLVIGVLQQTGGHPEMRAAQDGAPVKSRPPITKWGSR